MTAHSRWLDIIYTIGVIFLISRPRVISAVTSSLPTLPLVRYIIREHVFVYCQVSTVILSYHCLITFGKRAVLYRLSHLHLLRVRVRARQRLQTPEQQHYWRGQLLIM